jgi:sigma-B regulation protein RsbQ
MSAPDPLHKNHVRLVGNQDASTTLVFVHGFGTEQSVWQPVADHFAADCRIVLLDNVGAGRSDPEAFVQHRYLSLQRYAEDLLDICAALKLQDAILVGHSVGAMIGVLAALKQPDYFSRMVLIGASPRYLDDDGYPGGLTKHDLAGIYSTVANQFSEWVDAFAPLAMANPDRPQLARHFADTIRAIPRANVLTVLCSILQSDHRTDISLLDKPTLLLQTQRDFFVPQAVADYLHQHIPGSRLSMIDTEGHFPHISAPDQVAAEIRRFIAS